MEDSADERGSEGEHLVLHNLGAFPRARGPEFWRSWELPGGAEPCRHAQLPSSGGSVNDDQALKWLPQTGPLPGALLETRDGIHHIVRTKQFCLRTATGLLHS